MSADRLQEPNTVSLRPCETHFPGTPDELALRVGNLYAVGPPPAYFHIELPQAVRRTPGVGDVDDGRSTRLQNKVVNLDGPRAVIASKMFDNARRERYVETPPLRLACLKHVTMLVVRGQAETIEAMPGLLQCIATGIEQCDLCAIPRKERREITASAAQFDCFKARERSKRRL
jgi:hypothetical protein